MAKIKKICYFVAILVVLWILSSIHARLTTIAFPNGVRWKRSLFGVNTQIIGRTGDILIPSSGSTEILVRYPWIIGLFSLEGAKSPLHFCININTDAVFFGNYEAISTLTRTRALAIDGNDWVTFDDIHSHAQWYNEMKRSKIMECFTASTPPTLGTKK